MTIDYSARSHVGRVRGNNEDNLYVDGVTLTTNMRERPFTIDGTSALPANFAVCDGMGGEDNGEIASLLAVKELHNIRERIKSGLSERLGETVQSYVNKVNESIRSETNLTGRRTGTTLALAVLSENGVYCFNLGDSRIYSLQRTDFKQTTNDHSLGNKLTRCIGIGDSQDVEEYPPILGDCRILICSDGLTDMVSESVIEKILRASERTSNAADYLLNEALTNGGKDNVTIIVADIKDTKKPFFHSFVKILKG